MIELVLAARDRIEAAAELDQWAADHGQPRPRVMIGYRQPRSAQDWPFVAVVGGVGRIGITEGGKAELALHLICGARVEAVGDDGYLAVAALDRAVLEAVVRGRGFKGAFWNAAPAQTQLLDLDLGHPNFQTERLLSFKAVVRI